ncbi:hypothetical protein EVAR_81183_1 [Eumeta japonica]|uniref:Uncharacterized protein n=1 Tax=Eumeta variegata TaxID=151549 RepID=A0A4C1UK55_EUMVA|nr:hypothetical protein EVAR_81183_1 [Eumeta japonica]
MWMLKNHCINTVTASVCRDAAAAPVGFSARIQVYEVVGVTPSPGVDVKRAARVIAASDIDIKNVARLTTNSDVDVK